MADSLAGSPAASGGFLSDDPFGSSRLLNLNKMIKDRRLPLVELSVSVNVNP